MKIQTSYKAGFTLVEIMIVVAIIGLLAAIAIPNFVKAREKSQKGACINNLRQIDAAIQQYALENNANPTTLVNFGVIQPYLGRGSVGVAKTALVCPEDSGKNFDSSYNIVDVQSAPTCFLDAGHTIN